MSSVESAPAIKIMVVDDDPSIGDLISEFLKYEGYEAIICTRPQQALDFIKRESVNLAFVDINMPEMNGLDLAANLKEKDPLCEVVFITGFGTFDNAIQAIKVGAYDYLRKPFGLNELHLCLKRFQERMELKNQVRRAEQRYYNLVQNIPCIVFVTKKDSSLEYINRASESMLGYTVEEATGEPNWLMNRIHPDALHRIKKTFNKAFRSRNLRFSEECQLIHKDGHFIHAIIGSIPITGSNQNEKRDAIQGMIVDITDRVFLEKEVIQREKLKLLSSISAEVAHGIRNPLVSIGGFARRLRKRFSDLPEGDIILRESKRLENILQRIVEYLKPVEVSYEECSLNDLISGCVDQYFSETGDDDLSINLNLYQSLSLIRIDKDILGKVFIELIKNTRKDMKNGGNLEIRTFESDNNYHIEFKSAVENIKIKDPELFFLPFNSSENEIGFPLSYRLLKNMGGILSYAQGERNIIFTVSLPKKPLLETDSDGLELQ